MAAIVIVSLSDSTRYCEYILQIWGYWFRWPWANATNFNFTSGQSMGDVQCASVTILDDTVLSGQRNLSIRLIIIPRWHWQWSESWSNRSSINVLIILLMIMQMMVSYIAVDYYMYFVYKSQHNSKEVSGPHYVWINAHSHIISNVITSIPI